MRHLVVICAKFITAVLVTFVCFEIYFRTTEISLPSFVIDDPVLGRAFKPNARAALIQEGFHMDRVNEYGQMGPAYPPERTEGTLRVALIGDSFVEAFQVFPRYNVRSVLEGELSRLSGRTVEALNFGLSGHTLRTMYASNKDLVARFRPDITVFVVVGESFLGRDKPKGPVCYLDENGDLKVNYDFAKSKRYQRKVQMRLTRQLGSYQLLQSAFARTGWGVTPQILFGKFAPRKRGKNRGVAESLSRDKNFELNQAVLRELGRLDRAGLARVIIVGHRDVPDYYPPVIEDAGLTYIDLKPELDELERSGTDPYYWPVTHSRGHWNHDGHRFIGEHLARRLWEVERAEPDPGAPQAK